MTVKKLTMRQKILVAGTLFGMFFGAGNLIFPVHLGQMAGRNAVVAMIGFIITAVGIPIFGVAAIGITHSDGLQTLSSKVGKGYGIFFTCLLYLTIGPLFAIPRCATALLSPGAAISSVEPTEAYQNGSFFPALIEGYGTMDAIAGLAFGIVVIDVIRRMGVNNDDIIAEDVLSSGLLAGALMALIYVLSILVGAQSRGIFELSENGGIALTQIAGHYLGGVGQFILAFTITFACLKTSIGLVTACSETFVKMTNGKISYRTWAILFTVFSFAVSNIGLSAIIEYSVPMLMLIYPPAIALILLAFVGKFFAHDRAVYVATMIGTWAAAIFDCMKTLPASVQTSLRLDVPIAFAEKYLPLFDKNLGWLLPALVGFVIGMLIRSSRKGALVPHA